jgi:hypothetical protein
LAVDPNLVPHFSLHHGLLRYKNRILLGNHKTMQQKVIHALHTSAIIGHSGVPVTCRRVCQFIAWTGLKSGVYQFITTCPTCQQSKPHHAKYLSYSNCSWCRHLLGNLYQWTSLKACRFPMAIIALWLLLIDFPNTVISLPSNTHSLHLVWLRYLCSKSIAYMGFPHPLFHTGTKSS